MDPSLSTLAKSIYYLLFSGDLQNSNGERGRVSGSDFQSGGVTLIVSKFDQPTFYRQERGAYFPRLNRGGLIRERLRGGG